MQWIIITILIVLLLILVVSNIVIVQQSRAYVVERLGAFRTVWNLSLIHISRSPAGRTRRTPFS